MQKPLRLVCTSLSFLSFPLQGLRGEEIKINKYHFVAKVHLWASCKTTFSHPEHKLGTEGSREKFLHLKNVSAHNFDS